MARGYGVRGSGPVHRVLPGPHSESGKGTMATNNNTPLRVDDREAGQTGAAGSVAATSVPSAGGGREPRAVAPSGTGRLGDRVLSGLASGAGIVVVALVALIAVFLLQQAWPALRQNEVNFLTSRDWRIDGIPFRFGVLDLLWATVVTSLVAMAIAVPFGVAIALFLTHYAPQWLRGPGATLIELLAAIPSIVYGLWGLAVVIPRFDPVRRWLQETLGFLPIFRDAGITGGTLLLIGIVLAIMILPIVTALSREVFAQVPITHMEGALALGATKWEMIRTAVLPFGKPGVISAAMLGLGRALGETIAVTFLVSSLPVGAAWSWSLLNGGETFASKIANNAAEFNNPQKTGAYIAAGLVLFILTFVVNAIARVIIERRKAFTE